MECERGKFCEEGCVKPAECPKGTYNPQLRGESRENSCLDCSAGTFCLDEGRSEDGEDCEAGECLLPYMGIPRDVYFLIWACHVMFTSLYGHTTSLYGHTT